MFDVIMDTAREGGAEVRDVSSHPAFPRARVEAGGLVLSVYHQLGRAEVCPLDGQTIPEWVVDPLPIVVMAEAAVVRAWVRAARDGASAREAWDAALDADRELWKEA